MTRVVVPFIDVSPETREALAGIDAEYVDVSSSDDAYWNLLSELWASGADFTVIEQDIVVWPDTLQGFVNCPNSWCSAPYSYLDSLTYAGLGCCRFRAEIMRIYPDLMDAVALHDYEGHGPKHWCSIDAAMQRELWKRNEFACTHHATVGHLHSTPTHNCC